MSNFPYCFHTDRPEERGKYSGTPFDYHDARELADRILEWHKLIANSSDWSQSNDAHYMHDLPMMALGLMELFSDPNAVRRLIMTGESVWEKLNTINQLADRPGDDWAERNPELVELVENLGLRSFRRKGDQE